MLKKKSLKIFYKIPEWTKKNVQNQILQKTFEKKK